MKYVLTDNTAFSAENRELFWVMKKKKKIPQNPEIDEYLMKRTVTESMAKKIRKIHKSIIKDETKWSNLTSSTLKTVWKHLLNVF